MSSPWGVTSTGASTSSTNSTNRPTRSSRPARSSPAARLVEQQELRVGHQDTAICTSLRSPSAQGAQAALGEVPGTGDTAERRPTIIVRVCRHGCVTGLS